MYQQRVDMLRVFLCEDVLTHVSDYLRPTFRDNEEFRQGIQLWFDNQLECIRRFGHISN